MSAKFLRRDQRPSASSINGLATRSNGQMIEGELAVFEVEAGRAEALM